MKIVKDGRLNPTACAEDAILTVVRSSHPDVSILELIDRIGDLGIDETTGKTAINRLLADSRIIMTSDRRIHTPGNGHH